MTESRITTDGPLCIYRPYIEGLPGILAIEVAPRLRHPSLLCGRITYMLWESDDELRIMQTELAAVSSVADFNRLTLRWGRMPSRYRTANISPALFAPAAMGWPFFLVTRWPSDLTTGDPDDFSRGHYTVEAWDDQDTALDYTAAMVSRLKNGGHPVAFISPEGVAPPPAGMQ
jgi:hypothetical protein